MLLDFGSGYAPRAGYKTCDVTGWAIDYRFDTRYYTIEGVPDNSVWILHCRNVLHHIPKLERLAEEFLRVLAPGGLLEVIDCAPEAYGANVFLDRLWYRGIIPRPEVWFAERYRDYSAILRQYFHQLSCHQRGEKEHYLFQKGPRTMKDDTNKDTTESIKDRLDEAGYDYAVAVATEAEIENGAACGQLSVITDD